MPVFLSLIMLAPYSYASLQTDGTKADYQSAARPLNLSIVGPVMVGGSDEKSSNFQRGSLPVLQSFVAKNLSEKSNNSTVTSIDPSALKLSTMADVRVYFVAEGAGFRNTLGFNTTGGAVTPASNSQIIFPDVTTVKNATVRSFESPLLPGDFVNLGRFDAGTTLDFFTVVDGANRGKSVLTGHAAQNSDRLQHMVAFSVPNSPFLLIGFEDLVGGDNDFNDVLFAVDIGTVNQQALSGYEPATVVMMAGFFTTLAVRRRSSAEA